MFLFTCTTGPVSPTELLRAQVFHPKFSPQYLPAPKHLSLWCQVGSHWTTLSSVGPDGLLPLWRIDGAQPTKSDVIRAFTEKHGSSLRFSPSRIPPLSVMRWGECAYWHPWARGEGDWWDWRNPQRFFTPVITVLLNLWSSLLNTCFFCLSAFSLFNFFVLFVFQ